MKENITVCVLMSLLVLQACSLHEKTTIMTPDSQTKLGGLGLPSIIISKPALYPEGIDYNPITDKFIVGSFREGAVYEVDLDGNATVLIQDNRLNSVLAVRVDVKQNRLLVVNSDIGNSVRAYSKGPKKLAALAIYDLTTGKEIQYINLGKLMPNEYHLANGMTLDSEGNVYITDSFAPIIYKVDIDGKASVFTYSNKFLGEGIGLNGIVYHPDGYLIVVKKDDGQLFKISLDNNRGISTIKTNQKFVGGDGLVLTTNDELIVIANRASGQITETVFLISSNDNWQSAELKDQYNFGMVYLTTGTIRKNKLYVMHSKLKALMLASKEEKKTLKHKATIQQIGIISQ